MILCKNNQSGATMIEALGVLTIITMLGVSIIKLVGNVFSMFNQNIVVNEVRDLQKAISGRYRFEGNYSSLFEGRSDDEVTEFLCEQKMAPFQMCIDGKLYNKMGGRVWVRPAVDYDVEGEPFDDYNKYVLVFFGLSDRACINAAQINWYTQKKSDVFRMVVNPEESDKQLTVDLPYNQQEGTEGFPVSAAAVLKACDNDDNNSIYWIFY